VFKFCGEHSAGIHSVHSRCALLGGSTVRLEWWLAASVTVSVLVSWLCCETDWTRASGTVRGSPLFTPQAPTPSFEPRFSRCYSRPNAFGVVEACVQRHSVHKAYRCQRTHSLHCVCWVHGLAQRWSAARRWWVLGVAFSNLLAAPGAPTSDATGSQDTYRV
jgi:hypothetical protein